MAIEIKPQNRGKLHRTLGVPTGKPIPNFMLAKAKNSPSPAVRKMATFAQNEKSWNHSK